MTKSVSILGSTGSIGQSTEKVLLQDLDAYDVRVVTANSNAKALAEQAVRLKANKAVVADEAAYGDLREALAGTGVEAEAGHEALLEAAAEPVDWTMAAIMGMAGLEPLLKAVDRGGKIAIANKEPLVAAGPLVLERARNSGATLLPGDSEHNAIFQVFEAENKAAVKKLIITGSGGPFREMSLADMKKATPAQALKHPNWSMGKKITIDSATLMNKALEVIEAHYFFGVEQKSIEVLIHPQSIIHYGHLIMPHFAGADRVINRV